MVQRMAAEGFRVLDYQCRFLGEVDAEEIYRQNHPVREGTQWHVARLVYGMGQSLGLLLGTTQAGSDACERMTALKGRSAPCMNRPGVLRYDFRAPNRSLSLMHSSDGDAEVERESAVFFEAQRLYAARHEVQFVDRTEELLGELPALIGMESFDVPALGTLFARLRCRVSDLLSCAGLDSKLFESALRCYKLHWLPMACATDCHHSVEQQSQDYLNRLNAEHDLVRALTECLPTARTTAAGAFARPPRVDASRLVAILVRLSEPASYASWDIAADLPLKGLLDRWESLYLRTSLVHFGDFLTRP